MRKDLSLDFGNRTSEKCHLFFKSTVQNEQYYPINTTYMSTFSFSSYKSEEVLLDETTTIDQQELIVYNDDHNTFEWVINCFVDVLRHTQEQAEQLSYMIHFTGKASVKIGSYIMLKPFKEALTDKGLSVVIS